MQSDVIIMHQSINQGKIILQQSQLEKLGRFLIEKPDVKKRIVRKLSFTHATCEQALLSFN